MEEPISYKEAFAELKEIISELENSETSIDELEEKVKRASALLEVCRKRLMTTEQRVLDTLESIKTED